MTSAGPFGSQPSESDSSGWELLPGDSCNIVFALVTGLWSGGGDDSPDRRANLQTNADWAQKAYDGEDKNRNNILDEGEDIFLFLSVSNQIITQDFNYLKNNAFSSSI